MSHDHTSAANNATIAPREVTEELTDSQCRETAELFKLLGSEPRLRILMYLAQERELNVTDLCERLGHRQPVVSHHLALMRNAGLVETRRDGKNRFYHIQWRRMRTVLGTVLQRLTEPAPIDRPREDAAPVDTSPVRRQAV